MVIRLIYVHNYKVILSGLRWLAALSGFNFKLVYRAGNKNQVADTFSWLHSLDKEVLFNDCSLRQTVSAKFPLGKQDHLNPFVSTLKPLLSECNYTFYQCQ